MFEDCVWWCDPRGQRAAGRRRDDTILDSELQRKEARIKVGSSTDYGREYAVRAITGDDIGGRKQTEEDGRYALDHIH